MNIATMCWYEGRYLVFPVRNESSFCLNYLDTETDSICREILLGSEVDSDTNPETIIDSKQICLIYMNDKFEVLFETVLPAGKYSNFSGWCALPECLMLYVDNRLDEKTDDQLEVEYISYP